MQGDDAIPYLDESIPYYEYAQPQAQPSQALQPSQPSQPASAIPSTHSAGSASGEREDAAPAAGDDLAWQPPRSRSRLFLRIGSVLGALLIILAGSYALFLHVNMGSKAVPRHVGVTRSSNFHGAACPFRVGYGLVEGRDVQCGYLTVPEDRSQAHGRTIQLAVAIYTIPGGDASAAPFLYLQGGPGGSLLNEEGPFIDLSQMLHFAMGSNFILLDQRGTGYSTPSLDCPEVSAPQNSLEGPALAAQNCHDRLVKSGINLQAYTTLSDAADVHDLIHALGYKQVNLYGVSYGTRLALTVMRLFPADIRSVILDSTLPTQDNLFTSIAADTQRAFNVLFQGCAVNPTCNAAYPHLDRTFYALVASLDASPAIFQDSAGNRQLLNGNGLIDVLHSAQYETSLIPQLPSLITQVNEGNYSNFASLANSFAFDALDPPSPISYGMYYSVVCGEDMDFITSRGLDMTVNGLQPQIRSDLLASLDTDFSTCSFWGQHPAPAIQKQPVTSAIPTLILSGEYDPATPPVNGQAGGANVEPQLLLRVSGNRPRRLPDQRLPRFYRRRLPATAHHTAQCELHPKDARTRF